MYTREDYIEQIIPHRLGMIEIMLFSLTEMMQTMEPKGILVYFDGRPLFKGLETAITNPAIEAGVINCRAMLEFLGLRLKSADPKKLAVRPKSKYDDDLHIESFFVSGRPLEKVTPQKVRRLAITDPARGENAMARLLHISNKEIAHPTLGRPGEDDDMDFELLRIGGKGIRALTVSYFYTPLGLNPPAELIERA